MQKTNLLVIAGISPSDFAPVDSIYTSIVPKVATDATTIHTELPNRFISAETWPKFSTLKCWYCDQVPAGYPKFIPINISVVDGAYTCDPHGHFNEWNCAIRYVLKEFPEEHRTDTLEAICIFEQMFSGRRKAKILPSPSKTQMIAYCGPRGITPKEYGEKIDNLNRENDLSAFKLEQLKINN
jgi:hypothetical protein